MAKVPPHNKDAEDAVLGAMMLEKGAFDRVSEMLTVESFYSERNQAVFSAIRSLAAKNQPIDLLTVVDELRASGSLGDVVEMMDVVKLTNHVTSTAHMEAHAAIIQDAYLRRELIRTGYEMAELAYKGEERAKVLLEYADREILRIGGPEMSRGIVAMPEVMMGVVEMVEGFRAKYQETGTAITGVPSGFRSIERATRGWQNTDLIILAARPSVGKTAFALNLARNAALSGHGVAIWSLEMKSESMGLRMLAAQSGVLMGKLQIGRMDDAEMGTITKGAVTELSRLPIYFDDSPNLTMSRLRASARRLVAKKGVKLLMIDYLQLMSGEDKRGNREQEISTISRNLKILARELNVPIIALSQLSREVEKRANPIPMLADLRESGAIEQDADMVIFLYADTEAAVAADASLEGNRYVKIAKQRNGLLTTATLKFDNTIQLFQEPDGPKWVPMAEAAHDDNPF